MTQKGPNLNVTSKGRKIQAVEFIQYFSTENIIVCKTFIYVIQFRF